MPLRYLLDTHILVRSFFEERRLSREQFRVLHQADRHGEPLGLSAITLLEVATLTSDGKLKLKLPVNEFFADLQTNPVFHVLPVTFAIAEEVASMGGFLRDPADRAIVATARVHGLQLITSDERIIDSKLVPVIE